MTPVGVGMSPSRRRAAFRPDSRDGRRRFHRIAPRGRARRGGVHGSRPRRSFVRVVARTWRRPADAIEFVEGDIRDLATVRRACDGRGSGLSPRRRRLRSTFDEGSGPHALRERRRNGERLHGRARRRRPSGRLRLLVERLRRQRDAAETRRGGRTAALALRPLEAGERGARGRVRALLRDGADRPEVLQRLRSAAGSRRSLRGRRAALLQGVPPGRGPVIYGDGEQSRDFTFVEDAVQANLLAASAPASACGRVYNVAGGRGVTVNQLADAVREVAGAGLRLAARARAGGRHPALARRPARGRARTSGTSPERTSRTGLLRARAWFVEATRST